MSSLSSRKNCTCGASSEPKVAVAIRQPPPLLFSSATHCPSFRTVPVPQTGALTSTIHAPSFKISPGSQVGSVTSTIHAPSTKISPGSQVTSTGGGGTHLSSTIISPGSQTSSSTSVGGT